MAVILKAPSRHTASVIFLHGLGDSGRGWADVCEMWQRKMPWVRFVCPNAPIQPVTINGGMRMPSWHDIASLDKMDPRDFHGLEDSRKLVEEFLQKEIQDEGIPPERIVLGGFSQGCGLAVYTSYQYPKRLAGVVGLSGYLPYRGDFSDVIAKENAETPAFLCHGTVDEVVSPDLGKDCYDRLKAAGVPAQRTLYPGLGHSADLKEIEDVLGFLQTVIPEQAEEKEEAKEE